MSVILDRPEPALSHEDLMLAAPGKLFSARGWIFELKHDGFRCLASKCGDVVRMRSRSGRDMAAQFPEVAQSLREIEGDFVLDGELVVCDEQGRPQWDRLQKRSVFRRPERIAVASAADPACIFAFDLLWLDGEDHRAQPLLERKAALHALLPFRGRVRYAGHFADSSEALWELAVQLDLEGIVAKDGRSRYTAGRSDRWLKVKTDIGAERERLRRGN